MKKRPIKIISMSMFVLILMLTLAACATQTPAPTAQPASSATSAESVSDETATTELTAEPVIESTLTATAESSTATTTTLLPTQTSTATLAGPTETASPTLIATPTESIGDMLKTHIVFFLLLVPGGKTGNKRTDACGNLKPEPIISKRLRTGDKIEDVQIALNMLFSVGVKYYGAYYNAMWNTQFTIDNYQYIAKDDYMIIQFGGFFPYSQLSACDKHGIREQIWSTFFYYGFREKTFKVADGFLIDRLGGD